MFAPAKTLAGGSRAPRQSYTICWPALLGTALVVAMNGMGNSLKTTFNTTSGQMSTANASA